MPLWPLLRALVVAVPPLLLAACTMPRDIKPVPALTPVADIDRSMLAAIQLDRVVFSIPRGTLIGTSYDLYATCGGRASQGDIFWNSGRVNDRSVSLRDAFFQELARANFNVLGDPEKLFEQNRDRPDFLIGAQVTRIDMNICDRQHWYTGSFIGTSTGEGSIDVTWQVFSNLQQRVVYTTKTQGYAKLPEPIGSAVSVIIENTFAAAAANLAADTGFVAVLRRDERLARSNSPPVADTMLRIAHVPPFADPLARNSTAVRNAAVTILIGTNSHGSGFFITDQGHILTNHHVVGEADTIPVRLSNGAILSGRVLRRHAVRDVALVKVEANGMRPLPIRSRPVEIAEEVFAVGTPLDRDLTATVTRGIVSAVRRRADAGGMPDIQADAPIQGGNSGGPLVDAAGNVVGIAAAGYSGSPQNTNIGVNFFIPIGDALEKLRIEVADRIAPRR